MSTRGKTIVIAVLVAVSLTIWLVYRHSEQGVVVSPTGIEYRPRNDLYPSAAQAPADLENALAQAARENKHVILDFGGNWCPDCQVLDIYLHYPSNLALLRRNYTMVHVNIGSYDQNLDLAARYDVPLKKGVPALVVLDSSGKTLYVQREGEFEKMSKMDPSSVTTFLKRWKP